MRREVSWLLSELPGLVARGVLNEEAAESLRRHYGAEEPGPSRMGIGQILLAAFGAILVGGGIILILAHNWDELSRPARAAIALGTLLVAQALALYAVARRATSPPWIEATSGLLVAAVGAAIALVGQTYHVGGSFETLMRSWLWLVVLVPYLTGSSLAAVLFWGLIAVRVLDFRWRGDPGDSWLLALAGLPFLVQRVRAAPQSWATALVVLTAALATFLYGTTVTVDAPWPGLWSVFGVAFLAALVAAASWPPAAFATDAWRRRLLPPAWLGLVAIGTVLSFSDDWHTDTIGARSLGEPAIVGALLLAVACAAFTTVVAIRLAREGRRAAAVAVAAAPAVVILHAFALGGKTELGWIGFNLWLLAVGAATVAEGIREHRLGTANRGLAALAALVLARFFDSDLSFLARGLAFVAIGAGCFALNFWMMRRARKGGA